jgi:hypothetical protein
MIVHFPFDVSKQRVPFDAARASVSKNDSINAIKIKFIVFQRIQMIIKINRVLSSGILIKLSRLRGIFIALERPEQVEEDRRFSNQDITSMFMSLVLSQFRGSC